MNNRMGVLSRRLGRFAVVFSVATFFFFLIGLFASATAKGQLVFVCAGLFSACLFATFFLWLAHGFAWAMIPEKPAAAKKPAEELKSIEEMRPAEQMRSAEQMRPAEALKSAEAKPAEEKVPAEVMKPLEVMKPVEEEVDPPDAKYTITGKRIY